MGSISGRLTRVSAFVTGWARSSNRSQVCSRPEGSRGLTRGWEEAADDISLSLCGNGSRAASSCSLARPAGATRRRLHDFTAGSQAQVIELTARSHQRALVEIVAAAAPSNGLFHLETARLQSPRQRRGGKKTQVRRRAHPRPRVIVRVAVGAGGREGAFDQVVAADSWKAWSRRCRSRRDGEAFLLRLILHAVAHSFELLFAE
jgi:hypothetical protein